MDLIKRRVYIVIFLETHKFSLVVRVFISEKEVQNKKEDLFYDYLYTFVVWENLPFGIITFTLLIFPSNTLLLSPILIS